MAFAQSIKKVWKSEKAKGKYSGLQKVNKKMEKDVEEQEGMDDPRAVKAHAGIRHDGKPDSLVDVILNIPHPNSYSFVLPC